MFNIRGMTFGREGDGDTVNKMGLTLPEVRRSLVEDFYCGFADQVIPSPAIPNAFEFGSEEGEAIVVALTGEDASELELFANEVNGRDGQLFDEDNETWANGDPLDDDDREALGL